MAEAIQVPIGIGGIPQAGPGAVVTERGTGPAQPIPALPSSQNQAPGYVPNLSQPADHALGIAQPTQAPAGLDAATAAQFAQFQAFLASQGKAPAPTPAAPAASKPQVLMQPTAALELAVNAAAADPVLGSMLGIFDSSGKSVDRQRAFGNALVHGDTNLIDVAYLREVAGADGDRLATLAKGIVTHCNEQASQATQDVYTLSGGEANWDASSAAFNKGAPAYLKQVVGQLIDSGDRVKIKAGAEMVVKFAQESGYVAIAPTGQVQAGGGAPGSGLGLGKEEFQKLHNALDKNDRNYNTLRNELIGRRGIGKSLGM